MKHFKRFGYLIYDFTGLRWILLKAGIGEKENTPKTIVIWFIGIYLAFYTFSIGLYESRKASVERRVSILSMQLQSADKVSALNRIAELQRHNIPTKPIFLSPDKLLDSFLSPFKSLYKLNQDPEIIEDLKGLVEAHKQYLNGVNLSQVDLSGANLSNANLEGAILIGADLEGADLSNSHGVNADFSAANLSNANLSESNFQNATFNLTNVSGVNFTFSDMRGASFYLTRSNSSTDWIGAKMTNVSNVGEFDVLKGCFSEVFEGLGEADRLSLFKSCKFSPMEFKLNSSQIDLNRYKLNLRRLLVFLFAWPEAKVRLSGHTHSIGTPEYNIVLGQRMAESVKNYLVLNGAQISQLIMVSYGEIRPIVNTTNELAHIRNNRVEISVEL
jgi:uncharacterized protein YjbI with pentapeptide repeats